MAVISQNHKAPYRQNIALGDVTEQFAQKLKVYAPHTRISPRTWSEPPVGPNMLAERHAFPTRASRIQAREMTSAIGAAGCWELDDDIDVHRIAANMIDGYMANIVVDRTHGRHRRHHRHRHRHRLHGQIRRGRLTWSRPSRCSKQRRRYRRF